ncbi:MAG TPA: protoporphyrinogen oxidase [Anaerolineales bacterium]|nr:protoporphyrinogen oxidase [Anaerolineales bacterium]
MRRLVVVGGGIAGLSAAYYASKLTGVQVTLCESSDRWGGKIITERIPFEHGQFVVEGGPDSFLATKVWGVALCKELGLSERLQGANPHQKKTYLLNRDRLLPLPDGLTMMIPTDMQAIVKSRLLSWFGKARMGLDFVLPPKALNGDESLGAFISRRLGREAYESLIEPLMSGIYAGDGDRLSLASTFPHLRDLELEYGSLARGALKMRQRSNGKPIQGWRSVFVTPTSGLAEIVEKLVEYLKANGADLKVKTKALQITNDPLQYRVTLQTGETLNADSVVLATPAFAAGQVLESLNPLLASDLQTIPYSSTATISLAYRQSEIPRQLDGYGYVIPRREGRRALACTWTSVKFSHRAPETYALLRVFVGRAGQAIPWNETDVLAIAKEELKQTLNIAVDPLLERVFLWEQAMPQYNLGHPATLKRIDEALENHPGLALAGNGYRGIGIPDCIHSGELAVEKLTRDGWSRKFA